MKWPSPRAVFLTLLIIPTLAGCAVPRWPVHDIMTSAFGLRWDGMAPDVHRGVDIRAVEGTPVRTMAAGRVRFAGWMDGYGNVVWIDHPGRVMSVYAHLSDINLPVGRSVENGELVGATGSTGTVSGPHLHFEVWKGGRQVDPVVYLGGRP